LRKSKKDDQILSEVGNAFLSPIRFIIIIIILVF
jgi:hypothetical protein